MQVGDLYTWVPYAFEGERSGKLPGGREKILRVKGRVILINQPHRYYTVEGMVNGQAIRESFKTCGQRTGC